MTMPGRTPVLHKGGTCNNDMDCLPSSPPTLLIWHPPTFIFSTPCRIHSEDTILWTTLEHSLCDKLQCFSKSFIRLAYSILCKGGKSTLITKTSWKINFNFEHDVLTIYVNFNISLTTGSERGTRWCS